MDNQTIKDMQDQIAKLQLDLSDLTTEMYKGNFSGHQDFSKYSNFTSGLKVPHYDTAPASADIGEIIEVGGKLCIASTANNFTIVGTQS